MFDIIIAVNVGLNIYLHIPLLQCLLAAFFHFDKHLFHSGYRDTKCYDTKFTLASWIEDQVSIDHKM